MKRTLAQQRSIAPGAARSYLRQQGVDPKTASADSAWNALDDLERINTELVAVQWRQEAMRRYHAGNANQVNLFLREWNKGK